MREILLENGSLYACKIRREIPARRCIKTKNHCAETKGNDSLRVISRIYSSRVGEFRKKNCTHCEKKLPGSTSTSILGNTVIPRVTRSSFKIYTPNLVVQQKSRADRRGRLIALIGAPGPTPVISGAVTSNLQLLRLLASSFPRYA